MSIGLKRFLAVLVLGAVFLGGFYWDKYQNSAPAITFFQAVSPVNEAVKSPTRQQSVDVAQKHWNLYFYIVGTNKPLNLPGKAVEYSVLKSCNDDKKALTIEMPSDPQWWGECKEMPGPAKDSVQ